MNPIMKLLDNKTDLAGLDCHLHSTFSPDAAEIGSATPQAIVAAVRKAGLRGFIITDHLDVGHWGGRVIEFDKYFKVWNDVRANNPDLTVYIGLEVGYEDKYADDTAKLIRDLPLEYVINSVHYWEHNVPAAPGEPPYLSYLQAILRSLDAPYEYSAVGHIGFLERYLDVPLEYDEYKPVLEQIIQKLVSRGVRLEENTNSSALLRLPGAKFLSAYAAAGGTRPVLGSDAHSPDRIGYKFKQTSAQLDKIFGE